MYIRDEDLRKELKRILKTKTKNQVVTAIRSKGEKFQQYHIDNFLRGASINIDTLHKIEKYVIENFA
jgi:hypothetical protein